MKQDITPAIFARVFTSDDGQHVMKHLQRMTLDQATGSGVTDAHLRHLEGQRFIVKYIINQITKGHNND